MRAVPPACLGLEGKLIVSCQAPEGDVFREPGCMARFARAAVEGGAAGIRANGAADVRAIRQAVVVPIIGIQKTWQADGTILITPSLEDARELVEAGADVIALDCTRRGQDCGALERMRRVKLELGVPVMADIATVAEAVASAAAGADFVLSTMRGYTTETQQIEEFEPAFIAELVRAVDVPVIAEGRIRDPEQACRALEAGAFAVIIGTAITRPQEITRRFASALARSRARSAAVRHFVGIDLGGTNTKSGVVSARGELALSFVTPTPAAAGRAALLGHLVDTARHCLKEAGAAGIEIAGIGVATAGWVNPSTGEVVYATENLPGWTGTEIGREIQEATGLLAAVENDANALAVAEKHFGAASDADDFISITLGTGVGGGCYVGGRLHRGAHFMANGLGHISIEDQGLPCTCGRRGCLEVYANAAALLRYAAAGAFASAEDVIAAANTGDAVAASAIRTYARHLATGCATIVHLLDPEMLILSGGLAQSNPLLLAGLEREMAARVTVWSRRRLRIVASPLGYWGGVLGAVAVALEKRIHAQPCQPV